MRRRQFHDGVPIESTNIERSRTFADAKLYIVRVDTLDDQIRRCITPHERVGPELKFEATPLRGVDVIAGCQRRIESGSDPIVTAGTPERHRSLQEAQAHGQGRVVFIVVQRLSHDGGQGSEQDNARRYQSTATTVKPSNRMFHIEVNAPAAEWLL